MVGKLGQIKLGYCISQLFRYIPLTHPIRKLIYQRILKSCGTNLEVSDAVVIRNPENIEIGSNVSINEFCFISGYGGLKIGSYVRIAPGVKIFTFNHSFKHKNIPIIKQGFIKKKVEIGEDCWIGSNVTILGGVEIGKGSIIGAGSVVNKDIPSYSIAVGVPAKVIKQRG